MLKISNLDVEINNKKILKDFNLEINNKEIHAIMGPNGIGKSTICKTIIGDSNYIITNGKISFDKIDILKLDMTNRALKGIYLINQNPIEIHGVTNAEMLRVAIKERTGENVDIYDFNKKLEDICDKLSIPRSFIHRGINEGMSGGERKKNELLHLWMLEPRLIILDELDSGLDVDSLKIVCKSIKDYYLNHDTSILIITHGPKLLELLDANFVHILNEGTIVKSGTLDLALKIGKEGYKKYNKKSQITGNMQNE